MSGSNTPLYEVMADMLGARDGDDQSKRLASGEAILSSQGNFTKCRRTC